MKINEQGLLELTNNEAREYFKNKQLSYNIITKDGVIALKELIKKELRISIKHNECDDKLKMSQKIRFYTDDNSNMTDCYLYLNSDYFTRRECVSFNSDGFIGFAGWACTDNTQPILRAFIKWCDVMAEKPIY